ncbi:MAG: Translation initiation factor 2 subunit gamma [Candidatus Argoarchaeum ethanivorans]|uniref:Translation initiation factor 2 subunit gamma n=1 Tax=Candidatus Argoarchaeum ethanivorans TaxID=2608793 RepID=A0A811TAY6_9EURY|nr:MAG: Translation initiation factor 2 subunit gamma [Candidatus Argoarchaeum ethanivorans]
MQDQPVINIGIVGHVDHGKTTLVKALSGVWTDRHSEEVKRGISIRLGYADITFKKCMTCDEPECYTVNDVCEVDGSPTEHVRTVSFVDSPGHETLMATMLSGAAIMDGAVLVIAANESCPQPQTKEHLMALNIIGIRNIVIVQNKIDLVTREEMITNYKEIKEFVKGTVAETAPIIPVSAQHKANIDLLIQAIEKYIPTPERKEDVPPMMLIARSFDVNKPGTVPEELVGGVIGGTLSLGKLHTGDEIEIRPGLKVESGGSTAWMPIRTIITQVLAGGKEVSEITPGGLIGVGTQLDPALTKSDSLVGQVAGYHDSMPPTIDEFIMETHLLTRVVGTSDDTEVGALHPNEVLMLNIGTATTVGVVASTVKKNVKVKLKRPVCASTGVRVAISRRIGARWRFIGSGVIIK